MQIIENQNPEQQQQRKIYIDLPMGEIPELKESFYDETNSQFNATPSQYHRRFSNCTNGST
jgi:hypothetical protein